MATDAKARDEGDDTLTGDDDLAPGDADVQDEKAEDTKEQAGQNDKDKADKEKDEAAAEIERLKNEARVKNQNIRALTREVSELKAKLAKAGVGENDDPADVTARISAAEQKAKSLLGQVRAAQKSEAVREAIFSDERYEPYAKNVRYIVPTLELDDEADVDDDGRYDPEVLREAALAAVKQYVKDNPRTERKRESAGGSTVGDPARGGAVQGTGGADILAEAQRLNEAYGGVLTRVGKL